MPEAGRPSAAGGQSPTRFAVSDKKLYNEINMDKINSRKLQHFHSLMLNFDLGLFIAVLLPFVLFIEQFVKPKNRGKLWRRVAVWVIKAVFNLNNIKTIVRNQHNIYASPLLH